MKDCGMGFSWNLFGMTMQDAQYLSQGLSKSRTLTSLAIQASNINDDLCQLLCCGLKDCTALETLGMFEIKLIFI
jgi:hypothetical protein